jgi:hypothetical protein
LINLVKIIYLSMGRQQTICFGFSRKKLFSNSKFKKNIF